MKINDVTGLSIALVDDQRVVWTTGFGYADKGGKIRATPETVYRAGSISKLFTSTAAMQLAEQGKLDIDKPLKSYVPDFSIRSRFQKAGTVTPRLLMTHHSGLPSDILKGMWAQKPEPFSDVIQKLKDEYAPYPPDTVFSYSNLGMTLLGIAIEKVSGRDIASHIAESVLRPLGMTKSSFSAGIDSSAQAAKAYRNDEEAVEFSLRDIPAGGLNSTVLDLSHFMQMVFAGGKTGEQQIIKPETLAEMLRPQNLDVPLDLNYYVGIGWMLSGLGDIDIKNAGTVAHHDGATLYHRAQLIILPEHKLGVVVMTNSSTGGNVVNKIAAETLRLALEAKTGIKQPDKQKPVESKLTMDQETLQDYEGRYATLVGMVTVTNKSDYLQADVMGKSLRLLPRDNGLLGMQFKLFGLFPISLGELDYVGILKDAVAGREILKARMNDQEILIGEKILTPSISEKWLSRSGEYEIVNLGDDALLVEKIRLRHDGVLLLIDYELPYFFRGTMSLAIKPISENEAIIYGLGRGMGESIEAIVIDNEELLRYSGFLLRKTDNKLKKD